MMHRTNSKLSTAWPAGVNYTHCVSLSMCRSVQLLDYIVYFDQILHTYQYCMSILLFVDEALLFAEHQSDFSRGQFMKMLITIEPHGIFELKFAFILTFPSHWYGNSPSNISVGRGLLSKCSQPLNCMIKLAYLYILIL